MYVLSILALYRESYNCMTGISLFLDQLDKFGVLFHS